MESSGTPFLCAPLLHHVGAAAGCDLLILLFKIKRSQPAAAPTGVRGVLKRGGSGRKAASGGNPLPLFWHCRFATGRKAPVYGVF